MMALTSDFHAFRLPSTALAPLRGMPALSVLAGDRTYRRRTPETEPLYQVMAEHLETFLERTRSSDRQLPAYVERELRTYLECGILPFGRPGG